MPMREWFKDQAFSAKLKTLSEDDFGLNQKIIKQILLLCMFIYVYTLFFYYFYFFIFFFLKKKRCNLVLSSKDNVQQVVKSIAAHELFCELKK